MDQDVRAFNDSQSPMDKEVCDKLASVISRHLPEAVNKIWHRHPVWFLNDNPIVGYSKLKAGIRLMFWSGASFDETDLKPGTGKFKDASKLYSHPDQINMEDLTRWIAKSEIIQWDYKNIYSRKGQLVKLDILNDTSTDTLDLG